jgi:leucyl-tRNA synthetase
MKSYDHKEIEGKWQKEWEREGIYKVEDKVPGKENYYTLVEFTYPSGNLHVGHWYAFAVPDIFARYKRMQGFNVLYPMGFDAFGLPAENAAIKLGADPKVWTYEQMKKMRTQLHSMGAMFPWDREVVSCDPEYYKWTQWMFTQFLEHDLVYRDVTKVNWCPKDQTILANEQVVDGCCERCGTEVTQRDQEQWMLRITKYADRLIDDLDKLNWPEEIKASQRNWIGRSEGSEIAFALREEEMLDINTGPGSDAYREGEEIIDCDNVVVIIEHPDKDEFLCARWKQVDWQGFVTGGIEEGKTIEETVLDEVREETGYQNPKIVRVYDQVSHNIFWHVIKNQNRKAHYQIVHVKLENLEQKEISAEEAAIAEFVWVPRAEVNTFLKREDMKYPWRVVTGEDLLGNVSVFTTRADTLFGVTYIVLAPEHDLVMQMKGKIKNFDEVEKYITETKKKSELDRQQEKVKTGVELKGIKATNPVNGEVVPVWIADYVLAGYGTGAVMAVPAHDERDFQFARKYNLSIMRVINDNKNQGNVPPEYRDNPSDYLKNITTAKDFCFLGEGPLMNSGEFNDINSEEARKKITEFVAGKLVKTYRLRDWGISRQRYWGTPIPIVYDPEGKAHPVPDEHLPWLLPTDVDHTPDGTSPLARSKELLERTENIFGKGWRPEVETMDTFVDSSWYFYRYLDNRNDKQFASKEKLNTWMPVDLYMGGAEHTTMHVLYSRFWVKAMHDLGLVKETEPYTIRRNRGLILGPDGEKMSKSKGNVVNPDEIVERLGADTVRMYLAFMGPYGVTVNYPWDPNGVVGVRRFLERIGKIHQKIIDKSKNENSSANKVTEKVIHKTIKKITEDIEGYKFNTAISAMMICLNKFEHDYAQGFAVSSGNFKTFLKLLAPFAPHITEELWHELGETESIHLSSWPRYDESLIQDEMIELGVQINGKTRGAITVSPTATEEEVLQSAKTTSEIARYLTSEPKRVVYVPGKILNIVL